MSSTLKKLYDLLVERLGLDRLPLRSVPYSYVSVEFWLGAIVAASFMWLAISGLLLLLYYDYTNPAEANRRLLESKPFFRPLLTSHLMAANLMILGAVAHFVRNFLVGAYKKPREAMWIVGVIAGFLALQAAFFGYASIGDKIAIEAINIGSGFVSNSFGEYFGKILAALAFDVTESTRYLRTVAIHVAFAVLLGVVFLLHFILFEAQGIHPSPRETGWRDEPSKIDETRKDMAPWFPVNLTYIIVVTFGVWGFIFTLSAFLQGLGWVHQLLYQLPIFEGTPEGEMARPMPPWFLVYAFKLFQLTFLYLPEPLKIPVLGLEIYGFSALPVFIASFVLPILVLAIIPFMARRGSTHPLDNMAAATVLGLLLVYLAQLTIWGAVTLSFHTTFTAIVVFITPILTLVPGLQMLRATMKGEDINKPMIRFFSLSLIAIALPFATLIATRGYESDTGMGDAITGLLGVVFSLIYLSLIAFTVFSGESEPKTGEPRQLDLPTPLIAVAIAELFLVLFSAISLALINPLANPILASALIGLLLTSAYGVAHIALRALTLHGKPLESLGSELVPHMLVVLSLAVLIFVA